MVQRSRREGPARLFVYVNDSVIGIPGYFGYFYQNNKGKADLTVELLKDQ